MAVVTELRRRSFTFCCSDKLSICLVSLVSLPSFFLVSSSMRDLVPEPSENHTAYVTQTVTQLIFHFFYAAYSDF